MLDDAPTIPPFTICCFVVQDSTAFAKAAVPITVFINSFLFIILIKVFIPFLFKITHQYLVVQFIHLYWFIVLHISGKNKHLW